MKYLKKFKYIFTTGDMAVTKQQELIVLLEEVSEKVC